MTLLATPARAGDDAWTVHSPIGVQVHDLTTTVAQADRLYAASRGSGVYRSDDGGDSWTAINGGLGNLSISVIVASPLDPDFVVAAQVDGALQVSTDGGASWTAGEGGAVGTVSAIAIDPQDDRIVLALDGADLLRSADRGLTWQRDAFGTPLNAVAFAPGQPAVYIGADTGLFESTDGGDTWTDVAGPDVFDGWRFGNSRIVALVEDAESFSVIGLAAEDTGTQAFRMPSSGSFWGGGNAASRDTIGAAEHIAFDLTSDDPYLGRALLAGPHGIHGSVDAGARGDMATRFYGGANHWLPVNAGLHAPDADGYAITALLFDPATARRYFAVVDGAVMRYDGKVGADLRIGGREVDGYDDTLMHPICCDDTEDGGKRLLIQFVVRNHSAETATDVEFRVTVDPPVQFGVSIREGTTGTAFECNEVSAVEAVCTVDEFPRGNVEGFASIVAYESGEYRLTATATAAERDPTPGSNSATQMFAPEFPESDDEAAGETEDEPPADEPPADEPPAEEPPADEPPADDPPANDPPADDPPADDPPADEPADGDSEGDSESETSDEPPTDDSADVDSGSETDDVPPTEDSADAGAESETSDVPPTGDSADVDAGSETGEATPTEGAGTAGAGTVTVDVAPAEDSGDPESPAEDSGDAGDEPPPETGSDSNGDGGAGASDSADAGSDAGSDSDPESASGAGSAASDAAPPSGGSGSWSGLPLAALLLLIGVRRRRRVRARVTADA